jgi:quinol monooxygenase YgiN
MTANPVVVVGLARATEARAEDLSDRLLELAARAREEPGCLEYRVHRAASGDGLFVFYEAWRTEADLRAHLAQPYLGEFMAARMRYLEHDVDTHILTQIDPAAD